MLDKTRSVNSYLFKLLLVAAAVFFLCFSGAVSVSAAAKLVLLKNEKTYTSYDVTGNGKKDKLRYSAKLGRIYVNGKAQKLFAGVTDPGRVRVFYYSLNRSNTFILVEYAKSTATKISNGYRYSGGKFKKACEPMGAYTSCRIGRLSGNNLILYTSPSSGAATLSFTGISGKPFEYEETYKINTTKHTVVRASNYAKLRSAKSYYFITKKSIKLSSSGKTLNTSGPTLEYGQKVSLGRVFFSYTGVDAKSGTKIYELKFGGKTGWMKETSGRKFSKNDPVAGKRFDFFKDVVAAEFFHNTSPNTAFENFVKKTGATKHYNNIDYVQGAFEWKGENFVAQNEGDFDECSSTLYTLNNKGNMQISCAGIEIGMKTDEAARIYEATLRKCYSSSDIKQTFSKNTYENNQVIYLNYKRGDLQKDGCSWEDCVTMNTKNGIITSFYYSQTYYFEEDFDF